MKFFCCLKIIFGFGVIFSMITIVMLIISDTQAKIHPDGFPVTSLWEYAFFCELLVICFFLYFLIEELK